jgi:hypothetical protein
MSAGPLTVGWKEYLDFPEWGLRRVKVKIDTGARTSALGVLGYELVETPGGGQGVRARLAPYRRRPGRVAVVEAPVLETVVVRNSGGVCEPRPVVEALVCLGPVCKRVRLTLANRAGMCFPMILGRKALEGDFVVDVGKKYLLRKLV